MVVGVCVGEWFVLVVGEMVFVGSDGLIDVCVVVYVYIVFL